MTNYPIGDFLIRIGNAALAKSGEVTMPTTKLIHDVAKTLEKSGYLSEVKQEKGVLVVKLAIKRKEPGQTQNSIAMITALIRISEYRAVPSLPKRR